MVTKKKRYLYYFIFISLQCVLTFGLSEALVRVISVYNKKIKILSYNPRFHSDYRNIYSLKDLIEKSINGFKPYQVFAGFKANSKSFRTKEYSERKQSGNFRILTIGDSFTSASGGTPYNKHWPFLLEKSLQESSSKKIELINLGIPGVGPPFELRLWQLEGSKLNPDLVILGFCIGNDFLSVSGTRFADSSFIDHSFIVRIFRNLHRIRKSNREITHLARNLIDLANQSEIPPGGYEVMGYNYDSDMPTFSEQIYAETTAYRMEMCRKANREVFKNLFKKASSILLEFHEEVTASGSEFLVLFIPDEYQVDKDVFMKGVKFQGFKSFEFDVNITQQRLIEFCERNSIHYLDLLPSFQIQGKQKRLYKLRDTHWNIAGNELAAEQLTNLVLATFVKNNKR
ncbi:hypothetical protein ACFL27_26125 [candidate division CSSED10-310 bacterium]|uniref:AlgX/AlgJ SGNH hydrolase-like domain-containing protein n=1 Tax=candidate division CSSED10-310 bacterium TaxID=2855610 RepID=A0ABV6Z5F0_UNCC1